MDREFLGSKTMFWNILCMLLVACLAHARPDLEFSYDKSSPIGPSHWGEIKPEWHMCSDGEIQSPIDISDLMADVDHQPEKLHRHYKSSKATLANRESEIRLKWIHGGGHIYMDGTLFRLLQCQWHTPSEHHINGKSYPLEIHLVHQADDGRVAVIGMVYEFGPPDPFLSMLEHHIENVADILYEEINVGNFDPEWINIGSGEYFQYMGSLTTPPCTENIIWMVMKKVNTVSKRQVALISRAIQDEPKTNARPVQVLKNREIKVMGSLDKTM